MKKVNITGIPSIIWGDPSNQLIIVIHGSHSQKKYGFIRLSAKILCPKGYQLISFDLPEHGDRIKKLPIHTIEQAISDLNKIMAYAISNYTSVSILACSLGVYYSLLAYQDEVIDRCAFLSPVVDLIELTNDLLDNDKKSVQDVFDNQEIMLSNGVLVKSIDYHYILEHPITKWSHKTFILYGQKDSLIPYTSIQRFKQKFNCDCFISQESEHYFHTNEDMNQIEVWLNQIF